MKALEKVLGGSGGLLLLLVSDNSVVSTKNCHYFYTCMLNVHSNCLFFTLSRTV
jgi:hypothetical protein